MTDGGLAGRIGTAREARDGIPQLREDIARLNRALERTQAQYEGKAAAYRSSLRERSRTRLPALHAWKLLLGGRYRRERNAAAAAAQLAEQASDAAVQGVLDARTRLQEANRALERATSLADELPALEARQRMAELRTSDDPAARELLDRFQALEAETEGLRARLGELAEADHALHQALSHVGHALERLRSAGSWGTYDTFFGGGLISSAIKHDRIDDADRATRAVVASLEQARQELADVGMTVEGAGPTVGSTARALDIWFDNIFTDIHVQGRIREQSRALAVLQGRLQDAVRRVEADRTASTTSLAAAVARRNELL
ncbi:hypothetical protein ACIB24_07430 [Spongisporangium articulatum]|uniref:Uncharacterized protein n=1 Tax=Spongisporangium articulatum TaxID=3362603 RepID=A0ABW8AKK6_9ACTN